VALLLALCFTGAQASSNYKYPSPGGKSGEYRPTSTCGRKTSRKKADDLYESQSRNNLRAKTVRCIEKDSLPRVKPSSFQKRVDQRNRLQRAEKLAAKPKYEWLDHLDQLKKRQSKSKYFRYKGHIESRQEDRRVYERLDKAHEFETDFQDKATSLKVDTQLYDQKWLTARDENGAAVKPKKKNVVRVVQCNVLSDGMATPGTGGFGANWKPVCRCVDAWACLKKGCDGTRHVLKKAKEGVLKKCADGLQSEDFLRLIMSPLVNGLEPTEMIKATPDFDKLGEKILAWAKKHGGTKIVEGKADKILEIHDFPEWDTDTPGESHKAQKRFRRMIFGKEPTPKESFRLKRVLSIILKQNPDVITLEEVDQFDYFQSVLKPLGYDGCFKPKRMFPGGKLSPSAATNGGFSDGVAIFWNSHKLEKVGDFIPLTLHSAKTNKVVIQISKKKRNEDGTETEEIVFQEVKTAIKYDERTGKTDITVPPESREKSKDAYLKRVDDNKGKYVSDPKKLAKQVGLAVYLRHKRKDKGTKVFAVVAAHMKSGAGIKDKPDKVVQAKEMAEFIENIRNRKISHAIQRAEGIAGSVPVIFGCDFNTPPDSPAFGIFKKETSERHVDLTSAYKKFGDEIFDLKQELKTLCATSADFREDYNNLGDVPSLNEELNLFIKYKGTALMKDTELHLSTFKWRWGGPQEDKLQPVKQLIDFIFHSEEWKCRKVLSVPTEKELEKSPQRLPDGKYPSDHFVVAADLELIM